MSQTNFDAFENVCQKISLNLPGQHPWRWDREFNLALTVIEKKDEITVELPLSLEFTYKWDFSSLEQAGKPIYDFFQAGVGVVPGQKLFTMDPIDGVALYAAWWPWGDDERISLRLGLLSMDGKKIDNSEVKNLICKWLGL
jgi:hypothetical protein